MIPGLAEEHSPPTLVRVITLNVNGIRSAERKSLFAWLRRQRADVVCLQELKAQAEQLEQRAFQLRGYQRYVVSAEKKGYSGVAVYCRPSPERVVDRIGLSQFDAEGRYLQVDFGALSVASVYIPSGSSGEQRQAVKFDMLEGLKPILSGFRRRRRDYILCGDWNIAHREIDLRNWRSNRRNSGFLPEERAWLDWLYGEIGFCDVFRKLDPREGQYTWWSNRGQAWAKNVGWRLDLQVATPRIAALARAASIYKRKRFSDHAPLTVDYDYQL